MGIWEVVAYVSVAGAFLAFAWAFAPSSGDGMEEAYGREEGWSRLPGLFRAVWNFVALFEDTAGAALAEAMPRRAARLDALAVSAALPLSGRRVFAASAALCVFGVLLGAALATAAVAAGVSGGALNVAIALCALPALAGVFVPPAILAASAAARRERLAKELPFAIDLAGGAMRSGLDFGAALRYYVSLGAGGPLNEEFARVLADVSLGRPLAAAITDMAKRVATPAFASFAGVVSYGIEVGAPISDTLKIHASELRRERFAIAEEKARKAPGKMIVPLVLFIMPAVFIVVLTPMVARLKGTM